MGLAHLCSPKMWVFTAFFSKKMAVHLLILAEGFGVDDVEGDDEVTLLTPWTSRADTISIAGWWFFANPLKNMKVSWDDYSQYMEK